MGFVTVANAAANISEAHSGVQHANGVTVLIAIHEHRQNSMVIGQTMRMRGARPFLDKSDGASVVNFGSIDAAVAQSDRWVYPAAKGALHQLTGNQYIGGTGN